MATAQSIKSSGKGRIRATARLPEIDAYIRKVNKTSRPLSPTEIQVMREEGAAQLRVIKMNWPVRTGTSRAGWTFSVVGRMGQVAIIFENPVHYSGWIVRKGSSSDEPWFQTLLPTVWRAGKPRLVARLKKQIDKTQKEIAQLQEQGETKRRAILQAGQGKPIGSSGSAAQRFKDALRQVL